MIDAIYRCLADSRRRYVLSYLRDTGDGIASVGDLADHVVEQETHSPAPSRDSVLISLYHTHLPMLAGEGLIAFDERTETVRYRHHPALEQILGEE